MAFSILSVESPKRGSNKTVVTIDVGTPNAPIALQYNVYLDERAGQHFTLGTRISEPAATQLRHLAIAVALEVANGGAA